MPPSQQSHHSHPNGATMLIDHLLETFRFQPFCHQGRDFLSRS